MTATQLDIAAAVGLDQATVSRCLNDRPGHRPDTVARVKAAAVELGYNRPPPRAPTIRCTCTPTHTCRS
ncbi:MAG: LacI family DNA-binding transcriptional regulator, partial [Actinomycetia bacterium]|nr:LacI family DNA-binding transcriptional regulator [Actinomycetes bacterium]